MKITETNKLGQAGSIKKKKNINSASGDFEALLSETSGSGEGASEPVNSLNQIGMLDSLFAVQQIENTYQRTEQAIKHGNQVLDFLDELRGGLLTGSISREKINRLKGSINHERGWVMDQKLMQILDEIETRAEVELAKLEMSDKASAPNINPR